MERWSGTSWFTAKLDIERAVLLYNFTRMSTYFIDKQIREETRERVAKKELKYIQKLNITEVLRDMRGLLCSVVQVGFKITPTNRLYNFLMTVFQHRTEIKPGRSFSRARNNKSKRFHMICKSNT